MNMITARKYLFLMFAIMYCNVIGAMDNNDQQALPYISSAEVTIRAKNIVFSGAVLRSKKITIIADNVESKGSIVDCGKLVCLDNDRMNLINKGNEQGMAVVFNPDSFK